MFSGIEQKRWKLFLMAICNPRCCRPVHLLSACTALASVYSRIVACETETPFIVHLEFVIQPCSNMFGHKISIKKFLSWKMPICAACPTTFGEKEMIILGCMGWSTNRITENKQSIIFGWWEEGGKKQFCGRFEFHKETVTTFFWP